MEEIKNAIRTIPHFPKQGVMFRDITTLLTNPKAFKKSVDTLAKRYKNQKIDKIIGIESRGFIFGSALSYKLGLPFVLARKPGKLPAKTARVEYKLEYGKDAIEIHTDAISKGDNVLIIDDLIATAGTVKAVIKLVENLGGKVVECAFIINLPDLKGKEKLKGYSTFHLVEFEGE
ncbi:adenine phosphoribosyltransferase [Candidatus Woesearchaeota archaeon]|nr:adenine phosphoribosyltransferase [Candidatus Woesearchaeota archaeon]